MSAPKANTETLRLISKDNIIIAPKQYMGRKDISIVVIDTPKLCYINESAFKDMENLYSIQINAKGIVLCSDALANNTGLQMVSIKSINDNLFIDDKALSNLKSLRSCSMTAGSAWLAPNIFLNKPKKHCFIKISSKACISGKKYKIGDLGLGQYIAVIPNFDNEDCLFPDTAEFHDKDTEEMIDRFNARRKVFDNIGKINSKNVISKFFDTFSNTKEARISETASASETIIKR